MKIFKADNGVTYKRFESDKKLDGVATVGNKKVIINGIPSIEAIEGSWKHGEQVQVTVYSDEFKVEYRADSRSKWNRIEIMFQKEDFDRLIEEYVREAK